MCQTKLNERWHKSQRFRKSILRKMPALRVLQTTIQERITAKDISGGMKFQSKRRHSKHCRVQISWKPFYRMLIANETRFQGRCFTFSYLSDAYFKKNWWHFKKHNRKKKNIKHFWKESLEKNETPLQAMTSHKTFLIAHQKSLRLKRSSNWNVG